MERDYYTLAIDDAQTRAYDDQVWSSADYRNHVSPHMVIVEEDDGFFDDVDAWGAK